MVKVTLDNGLEFKVNERRFNDMRFLKLTSRANAGDITASFEMINKLLGDEQEEKVYKAVEEKDEDGEVYVDAEKAMELIGEIIEKVKVDGEQTGKNI